MNDELGSEWPVKDATRLSYDRDIRIGWWMALFLVAGTVVEYVVATSVTSNVLVIMPMNVVEAAGIMWFFMHVYRLWRHGGHGREE